LLNLSPARLNHGPTCSLLSLLPSDLHRMQRPLSSGATVSRRHFNRRSTRRCCKREPLASVSRLQALRGNHDRVQPHDVSCPILWKFINEANQLLDHLVAAAVHSFAMNALLSGSTVDALSGTRSAFWNEHKKLQIVRVEKMLGMLQENS
jgi:hypothetical protein